MYSVSPWSVSYISLKYMSYSSRPKNIEVSDTNSLSLTIIKLFWAKVLLLLKVTRHFLGLLWTNTGDAAARPLLAWQLAPVSFLPWWQPYWCICILLRIPLLSLSFFHCNSHLLIICLCTCSFFFFSFPIFSLFHTSLHHLLFFCSPFFFIRSYYGAHFSLSVCLPLKAIKLAIVRFLLHYPPKYIMLNSKKSRGICFWKWL